MKNKINAIFFIGIMILAFAPIVNSTSVKKDGFMWNYGTSSSSVYSNCDNNQPHSGKQSFYNYW